MYCELAYSLNESIKVFLESEFAPLSRSKPVLIGSAELPFQPTQAPINKLLLAYLKNTDRFIYLTKDKDEHGKIISEWLTGKSTGISVGYSACRFGPERTFPYKDLVSTPNGIKLVDQSACELGIDTDEESDVIATLSSMTGGGYLPFDVDPNSIQTTDTESYRLEFLRNNAHVLDRFMKDRMDNRSAFFDEESRSWVIRNSIRSTSMADLLRDIGGFSGSFLGRPINVSDEVVLSEDAA